jgi:AcrR family transcriptional regulator
MNQVDMTISNSPKAASGKRERTRLAIINAAISVIADKSLDNASIDDLMQAANMARASFYNYFQSRDEVLQAVIEEIRSRLHDNIEIHIQAEAGAAEIIACMMYGIMQYSLDNPSIGLTLMRLGGDTDWFSPYDLESRQFPRADDAILTLIKYDFPFAIIHTYIEGAFNTLLRRVLKQHIDRQSAEQLMMLILRGLGVAEPDINPAIDKAREFAGQIHHLHSHTRPL